MSLDPITALIDVGGKVIDKIFPDPLQRDQAKLELLRLQQTGELAILAAQTDIAKGQIEVNRQEAASEDMYRAGWRPFVGWVCGVALAWQFVLCPILMWTLPLFGKTIPTPPVLDNFLWELILGMLGLGGLRTFEKIKR